MNSEVTKVLSDYHNMIAGYIKTYGEYTATMTLTQSAVSPSTINYLNDNGFTCKLVNCGDYVHDYGREFGYEGVWYISKDSYANGGAFAEYCGHDKSQRHMTQVAKCT